MYAIAYVYKLLGREERHTAASHLCDRVILMKKLVLNVEQLRVDSYETTTTKTGVRGTVWGNSADLTYTRDFTCRGSTCGNPSNAVRCF